MDPANPLMGTFTREQGRNLQKLKKSSAAPGSLEAFCKANLPADVWKDVEKSAERIRFKAKLKQRELPRIDPWIQNRKPLEKHSAAKQ
jgi:hypothetical protein